MISVLWVVEFFERWILGVLGLGGVFCVVVLILLLILLDRCGIGCRVLDL